MQATESKHRPNPLTSLNMAVLTDGLILSYSYKTRVFGHVHSTGIQQPTLDSLIDLAHAHDLNTIWICPGSSLSQLARQLLIEYDPRVLGMSKSTEADGTPRFLRIWRHEGTYSERQGVNIGFPEHDSRWPWMTTQEPGILLSSIQLLQGAINWEVAWSPGHTGQDLMKWYNRGHPLWLDPSGAPADVRDNLAIALSWKGPLPVDAEYIHLFDKDAQHLASATGVELGQGSPEYIKGNDVGVAFKATIPGLWLVHGWGWLWTPELEFQFAALEDKPRPVILGAWLWLNHHAALRTWAEQMWEGRLYLKEAQVRNEEAAKLALKALKQIYAQSLGWLAHPSEDNALYRPDWWSMIVAGAKRAMQFKMRSLARKGIPVVYVNTDALGVASALESWGDLESHMLDRKGQLGGFKYVKTIPVTPEVRQAFESGSFVQCKKAINDL